MQTSLVPDLPQLSSLAVRENGRLGKAGNEAIHFLRCVHVAQNINSQ